MGWLKQNTAASLIFGPFVSETDGVTSRESYTSLSGILYKNNGASAAVNPAVTHTASGFYNVELTSGCVDTLGPLRIAFANSACHLAVWSDNVVVPANTYDALIAGSDLIDAQIAASGIAASNLSACAIDSFGLAATAANKIADHILRREWGDAASSVDGDSSVFRSLLGAVAKLVNKIDVTSGSLVVYEADDSTTFGTQGVTACNAASPIVTLDTQ